MHIPVLQKEVLKYLDPKDNENFIDCTIGEGGHATAILEKNKPHGKVLGIEIDSQLYEETKIRMAEFPISNYQFPNRLILVNDSYINLKEIVKKNNFGLINGILFDLGMSSWHLEESGRGFTFMKNEPLDMRYSVEFPISNFQFSNLTAEEIVNKWPEKEIEKILKEYGEERFAGKIAKEIIEVRKIKPIKTTFQLVDIIKKAVPVKFQYGRIPRRSHFATLRGRHYATRTFQALRITVNDELNNLKKVLPQAIEVLETGGRIAVISFHSLEDRIVKNFLREKTKQGTIKILTKKPVIALLEEIKLNPRARSAKLRVGVKI